VRRTKRSDERRYADGVRTIQRSDEIITADGFGTIQRSIVRRYADGVRTIQSRYELMVGKGRVWWATFKQFTIGGNRRPIVKCVVLVLKVLRNVWITTTIQVSSGKSYVRVVIIKIIG
jgi:hypothetical protein